jgi:hypothetical protein
MIANNYTINNTTITNSFNNPTAEKTEPDYLRQMRKDLLESGRYFLPNGRKL